MCNVRFGHVFRGTRRADWLLGVCRFHASDERRATNDERKELTYERRGNEVGTVWSIGFPLSCVGNAWALFRGLRLR